MRYAGFRVRFGAAAIDFLIFIPFLVISLWLGHSRQLALAYSIPYSFFYALYGIFFHGRYGQTPGKMVFGIKVTRPDGVAISYREAFLRHVADLAFAILMATASVVAYLSISDAEYSLASDFMSRAKLLQGHEPFWNYYLSILSGVWYLCEIIALISNEKKRAIHDFIAGTVVIYKDSMPGA